MGIKLDDIAVSDSKRATKPKTDIEHWLKRDIIKFGKSFGSKTKAYFYTELHILLESGISLKNALSIIEKGLKKKAEKKIVESMSKKIIAGDSFAQAMQSSEDFLKYEYFSVKIGEETGTLPKVVKQLAEYFERKNEYRKNIVSALTYPMIIVTTAVLVIFFMLKYVVPMFEEIFKQQQVELPEITQFIVSISNFFQNYTGIMLLGLFLIAIVYNRLNKIESFKKYKQKLLLKIPVIGQVYKTIYTTQLIQALSILLSAQVPMLNALHLVEDMIEFWPLKNKLNHISKDIQKGKQFSEALSQHQDFFKPDIIAMVSVAEQTNATAYIFTKLSQRYDQLLQRQSKTLTTFLEPLVILLVGIFVGFILVAMYLPMFKLSSVME